jgi:hypothetical protein
MLTLSKGETHARDPENVLVDAEAPAREYSTGSVAPTLSLARQP